MASSTFKKRMIRVTNDLITRMLPKMKGKIGKVNPYQTHIEWIGKRVKKSCPRFG